MTTSPATPLHRILLGVLCFCPMLEGCVDRSISTPPDGASPMTGTPTPAQARPESVSDADTLLATPVAALTPKDAMDTRNIGKRVRWAGGVQHISRSDKGVCLALLYAASGSHGAPEWMPEPTYQDFEACTDGAYDPELVQAYTEVTIIGRISGKTIISMGGGSTEAPVVQIEKLYRWSDCLESDTSPVCRPGFVTPDAAL